MEPRFSELVVERIGKGGGGREARPRKVRYVKGTDKQFLITAARRITSSQSILRELGRNEMRSSYLYSRCKRLARRKEEH